jgi:hypothetical protein
VVDEEMIYRGTKNVFWHSAKKNIKIFAAVSKDPLELHELFFFEKKGFHSWQKKWL